MVSWCFQGVTCLTLLILKAKLCNDSEPRNIHRKTSMNEAFLIKLKVVECAATQVLSVNFAKLSKAKFLQNSTSWLSSNFLKSIKMPKKMLMTSLQCCLLKPSWNTIVANEIQMITDDFTAWYKTDLFLGFLYFHVFISL